MSKPEVTDVVRARALELVDGDGNVRVRVGATKARRKGAQFDPDDYWSIEMLGRDGQCVLRLQTGPTRSEVKVGGSGPSVDLCAYEDRAILDVSPRSANDAWWRVLVQPGRRPDIENHGPLLAHGGRPSDRKALLEALPLAESYIREWEAGLSRRSATQGRHRIRELCAEFGVDVPEWAPAKRERGRASQQTKVSA